MISILLSGGRGSRLWPLSTLEAPKQFQKLFSGKSLLQETFDRMSVFGKENVYLCSLAEQESILKSQVPNLREDQYILQPRSHDSALAVAYSLMHLKDTVSPDEVLVFVPTDHKIVPSKGFTDCIESAIPYIQLSKGLFTIGIEPTGPVTRYGYIRTHEGSGSIRKVDTFIEKPSKDRAEQLLQSGSVLWNSGCILGTFSAFYDAFLRLAPKYLESYHNHQLFRELERTSFDYLIWEHYDEIYCIHGDGFSWSDIGTWGAFFDEVSPQKSSNRSYSSKDRPIIICGMEGVTVIDGEDGVLVFPSQDESEIKKAVQTLYGDAF